MGLSQMLIWKTLFIDLIEAQDCMEEKGKMNNNWYFGLDDFKFRSI